MRAAAAGAVLVGAGVGAARAAGLSDACPRQLAVRQTVAEQVAGWTAVDQQDSYPFVRIALYRGAPADDRRVVPTWESHQRGGLRDVWKLPRQPAGYYVACEYGNTSAVVTRKLDDDLDFCQADYDGRFSTLVVKRWLCVDSRAAPSANRASAPRRGGTR